MYYFYCIVFTLYVHAFDYTNIIYTPTIFYDNILPQLKIYCFPPLQLFLSISKIFIVSSQNLSKLFIFLEKKKKFSMCVCACLCAHMNVCVGPESRAAPMLNACDMPYWNLWNYILLEYCLLLALSPWVFLNCCCLENVDLFRDPYDFYPPQVPPWDKRRSFSFVMCPTSCWSHDTE